MIASITEDYHRKKLAVLGNENSPRLESAELPHALSRGDSLGLLLKEPKMPANDDIPFRQGTPGADPRGKG